MQIASQQQPACTIVLQPEHTAAERHAADELSAHLQQITGAAFTVCECDGAVPESAIIIGSGPIARALFPEVALESLGAEQLVMRTRGNRLLLAGGRPRGTLYAVYRFLQEQCGVRWWTPWATYIPSNPELAIGDLAVDQAPAFELRDPFWYASRDADWSARNACTGQLAPLDETHGGKITYKGFVHTFFHLVPPDTYFPQHPEWFSFYDGERRHPEGERHRSQLCTTNPELREFLVERVREWLIESPDANIVSISQDDTWGDCTGACCCPDCAAIDGPEGSHAGSMIALLNYLAGRLGPEFPHVAFDTLAYRYTRTAPRTIKPLPNVIVRLCSIECNFAATLEEPDNAAFAQDIQAWSALSQRLYVWDYTTNFAHYVLPHPNWFSLGPNLRFFQKYGVKGMFAQGAYQSFGAEMAELRAWMLAQLLWNPAQDDRALIDEFLTGYYGEAAGPIIRQYLNLLHDAASGVFVGCYTAPDSPFLRFDVLRAAEELWQQALSAVARDPERLWHVRQGHLAVRYAFLANWDALREQCRQSGQAWPLPESRQAVADAWLAVITEPGPRGWTTMTHVNEGGLTPQAFVAALK
ncbi:MAG: DUF4838 domain-containing protein [Armatimonadota bacterium]